MNEEKRRFSKVLNTIHVGEVLPQVPRACQGRKMLEEQSKCKILFDYYPTHPRRMDT